MNFDAYARTGVDLVNARLDDLDDLRALFLDESVWMRDEVSDRDLATFRRAQKRLRDVFEYGTSGRDSQAVAELNAMLEAYPVQPRSPGTVQRLSHARDQPGRVGQREYLAARSGAVGLALRYGSARFGLCADAVRHVYWTLVNCCRRFCSERCAPARTSPRTGRKRARRRRAGDGGPGPPATR